MNKPKCYAINRKKDYAEILIYGVIGIDWWTDEGNTADGFAEEFAAIEKEYDNIVVRINSPGGDIIEGMAIYNIISQSKKNVETKVDGVAASMAAIILLAGSKVYAPKTSMLMLHSASTCTCGNAKELRDVANQLESWDKMLVKAVSKKTGLSDDEALARWFDGKDHFINGEEAFELNLIDELLDEKVDIPDKASKTENLTYQELVAAYRKVKPTEGMLQTIQKFAARTLDFNNKNNQHTKTDNSMLKTLCALLAMNLTATEDEVINAVRNLVDKQRKTDEALEQERKLRDQAEAKVSELQNQIAAKDTEIQNLNAELGKAPASNTAVVDTNDTDHSGKKPEVVLDEINDFAKQYVTPKKS